MRKLTRDFRAALFGELCRDLTAPGCNYFRIKSFAEPFGVYLLACIGIDFAILLLSASAFSAPDISPEFANFTLSINLLYTLSLLSLYFLSRISFAFLSFASSTLAFA